MGDFATVYGQYLKEHIRVKHVHDKPYKCDQCDFSTVRKILLKLTLNLSMRLESFSNFISVIQQPLIKADQNVMCKLSMNMKRLQRVVNFII